MQSFMLMPRVGYLLQEEGGEGDAEDEPEGDGDNPQSTAK